jgi:hypothetical protein
MSRITSSAARLGRWLGSSSGNGHELPSELFQLTNEDRRYLTTLHDDSVPLPESASRELRLDNPRLQELRDGYADLALPVLSASRWDDSAVQSFLDLRWFRGESLITWHYRELPRITALKYFILMKHVQSSDALGLLDKLEEDGAFGCWTYEYPGYGLFSRDLLESVIELSFLERELRVSERERFGVLDIGAGYGRLAHRMTSAFPQVTDYCCTDAIPECTFVSEYYLRHRGCVPPARVVPLTAIETDLTVEAFDLAVNIHSFSECPYVAIEWWIELVRRLRIQFVLIVPNDATQLLSFEPDGSRREFLPLLEQHGYSLRRQRPVIEDAAIRELLPLDDHFHLFQLDGDDAREPSAPDKQGR